MNLGELIVELSADTAELEKSLEQAKKKAYEAANSIEKIFGNINLEVNVDDDSLVDLNKHLNLKVNHLKEVNKYFNNNPITVQVDDDSLVDLNKHLNLKVNHLKEVNKYFNSNPIVVHTDTTKLDELEERLGKLTGNKYSIDVQQNIDVKISDSSKHEITQIISDAIEDAFTSAVDKAVSKIDSAVSSSTSKSAGSNQNDESSSGLKEVIEELKSGFKAVNDSTGNKQLDEAISIVLKPGKDLITGFFEGISTGFGLEISKGMQDSLKKNSNIKMDEFGEKAADGFLKAFGVKIKSKKGKKSEVQSFGEEIVKDAIKSVSSGSLENIIQTSIGIAFDAAKRYSNTSGSQRATQQNNNESTVTPEILTPLDPIPLPQASRRNRRRTRVLPPEIFFPIPATELVPQQANRSAVDSHDLMSPFEKAQEQSKDFSYSLEDVVKSKFTGSNLKNLTEKIIKIKTSHQSLHKTLQNLMEKARTSGDFRAIESIYLGYQIDGKKAINEIDRLIAEMRAGGATQEQINTLSRAKSPISRATGKSSKLSQLYQKSKREAEKAETVEFVGDAAVGIGLDTIAGLREGLGKGQFTKLAIENALAYLFAIKKTFGIASPSEVMKGIGLDVGKGFENGAVASLVLANKRIADLLLKTVNESETATEQQKASAIKYAQIVDKKNQVIARKFKEGKFNESNASNAARQLVEVTKTGRFLSSEVGISKTTVPEILRQSKREVLGLPTKAKAITASEKSKNPTPNVTAVPQQILNTNVEQRQTPKATSKDTDADRLSRLQVKLEKAEAAVSSSKNVSKLKEAQRLFNSNKETLDTLKNYKIEAEKELLRLNSKEVGGRGGLLDYGKIKQIKNDIVIYNKQIESASVELDKSADIYQKELRLRELRLKNLQKAQESYNALYGQSTEKTVENTTNQPQKLRRLTDQIKKKINARRIPDPWATTEESDATSPLTLSTSVQTNRQIPLVNQTNVNHNIKALPLPKTSPNAPTNTQSVLFYEQIRRNRSQNQLPPVQIPALTQTQLPNFSPVEIPRLDPNILAVTVQESIQFTERQVGKRITKEVNLRLKQTLSRLKQKRSSQVEIPNLVNAQPLVTPSSLINLDPLVTPDPLLSPALQIPPVSTPLPLTPVPIALQRRVRQLQRMTMTSLGTAATATPVPLSTPVQQLSNADANQAAIVIKNQVKASSGKGFDFKSIFNIFKNFDFGAIASNLIQSFLKRFSEGKGLFSKIISTFSGIITLVKKVFGIASPSKVMQEIGLDFGAGFENGAIASLTLANKRIAEKLRDTVYNDPNATMAQKQAVDAQVARVTAQLNRIAQAYKSGQLTDNDAMSSLGKVTRGNIRVGQYIGVGQRELSQEFKDSRQYVASRSKNVFKELFDSFLYSAKQSSQTGDNRLGDYLKNFAITFVEDFLKKQKVTGSKGGAFKDILSAAFGGNKPAFIGTLLKGFFGAGLFSTFAERITNIIPDIIGSAIKNRGIGSILKTSLPLFASAAGLAASQAGGFVSNAITNNNAIKPGLINDLINSLTGVNLAKPTQKLPETLQTVFRTLTISSFLAGNQIPILKPLGTAATLINTLLSGKQLIDNTTVTSSGKPRTSVNEVVRNQIATNISSLGINSGEGIRGLVTQVTKTIVDSLTFKNMNLSPQLKGVVEKNKGIIDGVVNGAVSGILNLGIFTNKQSGILGKVVGAADAYGSGNVQGAISKGTAAVKGVTQIIGLQVDTSQIKIAMTALLLGISAFHKAFTEEGLNIGKALIKGFKEAQSNWISAKNDVRRGIQRAIGAESLKDTLNDIKHEWGKGVVSASRFEELFDVMGSTFRKRMLSSMSPNDREGMQGNILSFIASISTAFAPITTLATSLIPLFAPLLPLFGAIGGAALMLGKHIQGVVNSIKEIEPLQRRLEFLGGSKEGGKQEMAYALKTADKLNVPVREGVQAYSQLAIAARNTKLEGDGVRELYEGISASLSALGIGGQDAGLVFMAYTQILAKGKVSMEELRQQLGEKFPPAMGVFAKALGVSIPELTTLISRGALLSEDVLPKVAKVLQQDYGNAASGAQGLTVALTRLSNVGFKIAIKLTNIFGGMFASVVNIVTSVLGLLEQAMDELLKMAGSLAIGVTAVIGVGLSTIIGLPSIAKHITNLSTLFSVGMGALLKSLAPYYLGIVADIADGWLGAQNDLITNMTLGVSNIFTSILGFLDTQKRLLSDTGKGMFGEMVGELDALKSIGELIGIVFKKIPAPVIAFFQAIRPGLVEIGAMVLMFRQVQVLWQTFLKPTTFGAFKGLSQIAGNFTGMIRSAFTGNSIRDLFGGTFGAIDIANTFSPPSAQPGLASQLKTEFSELGQQVANFGKEKWSNFRVGIDSARQSISNLSWQGFKDNIRNAADSVRNFSGNVWQGFTTGVTRARDAVASALTPFTALFSSNGAIRSAARADWANALAAGFDKVKMALSVIKPLLIEIGIALALFMLAKSDFSNKVQGNINAMAKSMNDAFRSMDKSLAGLGKNLDKTTEKIQTLVNNLPSKGLELNLGYALGLGGESFKTDDIIKLRNANRTNEAPWYTKDIREILGGERASQEYNEFLRIINRDRVAKASEEAKRFGIGDQITGNEVDLTIGQEQLLGQFKSLEGNTKAFREQLTSRGLTRDTVGNLMQGNTLETVKQVRQVDKELYELGKKRAELGLQNTSESRNKISELDKQLLALEDKRAKLVKPLLAVDEDVKSFQKSVDDMVKTIEESDNPPDVKRKLKAMLEPMQEMVKEASQIVAENLPVKPLEDIYQNTISKLKDFELAYERFGRDLEKASLSRQSKIYNSGASQGNVQFGLRVEQINTDVSKFNALRKSIEVSRNSLTSLLAIPGIERTQERSDEIKELRKKLQDDEVNLQQLSTSITRSRYELQQTLIDQTKQVADYYRTSVREAQAVSIEFQKAQRTLEGSKMQNKLREALIGAGDNIYTQFIDGLINLITQTTEIEKSQLDARKQEIDYQNNLEDIRLRATELQRSLPGQIIPFDENKINSFDAQLKVVQSSVLGINDNVQDVVKSIGQDAVLATKDLDAAFSRLGDTITNVGASLVPVVDTLNQASTQASTANLSDVMPQITGTRPDRSSWAANALDILNNIPPAPGTTSSTTPAIPTATPPTTGATTPAATTPAAIPNTSVAKPNAIPTMSTGYVPPIANTTIADLLRYKPTQGQGVFGTRPGGRIHNKIDFDSRANAGSGANIRSMLSGIATTQQWKGQEAAVFVDSLLPNGTRVTIEYGHLALNSIKQAFGGEVGKAINIQAGQKLGNVIGHHLDFGVKVGGKYIHPQVFLSNLAKGDFQAIASQPPATDKTKANNITPASQSQGESVIRMQRLGQKDEFGLEKIQLAVIKQGKIIDRFIVNSGKADTQIFGNAGETKAGSKQPVEFGRYTIGKTIPSNNKAKMGNQFIRLEPDFKTERTAIGFHIDKDRLIDPGSSGCIVFANEAEFNKFKQALKNTGIKSFVFDQAVGAVEIAKNVASQVKPLPKSGNRVPGTIGIKNSSGISQGGNDLSPEEYARLTPLGKQLYELRRHPNILAMSNAVARAEGSDFRKGIQNFGYGLTIGGENVTDFSKHPYVGTGRKPTWIPAINNASTASGRYQMMNFNASIVAAKKQFGSSAMPDLTKVIDYRGQDQPGFSPGLQDLYFIYSLKYRGVLQDVLKGNVNPSVLNKLAPHYASIQSGANKSAYGGQGTPQGSHNSFLKFFEEQNKKLNALVMSGNAVSPDNLQSSVTDATNLKFNTAARQNAINQINSQEQIAAARSQQFLGAYRLYRQTEEGIYQALSNIRDAELDIFKTIAEGLNPNMSSYERSIIAQREYVNSLNKKADGYAKIIRDTQGTIDNEKELKAAFELSLQKFPDHPELALQVLNIHNEAFKTAVLQNEEAKKALKALNKNANAMIAAFGNNAIGTEANRLFGLGIQDRRSEVENLQKTLEQRRLVQALDPLKEFADTLAEFESDIASVNSKIQLDEKIQAIDELERTNQITRDMAKERRLLAEEEFKITQRNIELKRDADLIAERTNLRNRKIERDQFLQDSVNNVLDARSSVLKGYGLDFTAEKLDKQRAISNQRIEAAKAVSQLEDFIEKNEFATVANKLTNEQIKELRENLRQVNEYKLEAIKLQFSELGSVIKGVTSTFRTGFKEFLTTSEGIGKAFGNLLKSIGRSIIDLLADIASKRMASSLFNWVGSLLGGSAGIGRTTGGFVGDVLPNNSFNMAFAGGMVEDLPTFAKGGIVKAFNREKMMTGRTPHLIVASEGERILNHRETAIWNKLQTGVPNFASGGMVGQTSGNISSRIGSSTTINVPVSVEVGSNSEVDATRLSQVVQSMVSDGIRREMRVGGSIHRGNPYSR